jgi:hypothetical protein
MPTGRVRQVRVRLRRSAVAVATAACLVVVAPASAQTAITIAPSASNTTNTIPFACTPPWLPYAAYFYKDVPPFELKPGDTLAFDLIAVNDTDIQLEIALAPTTTNGGLTEAQPFTTVASNAQTPANPRGDAIQGTYELQFLAEAPFSFPGGGLILRFSNPGGAFASDATCVGNVRGGTSSDPSGFLVQRATGDSDGVSPWENLDPPGAESILGFRLIILDPPQPEPEPQPKAGRTVALNTDKGKVEKHRKVGFSGQIDAPQIGATCEVGQAVELQRRKQKEADTAFQTFATVQSGATGSFSVKHKVKKTYVYRAAVAESAACANGLSNTRKVRVRKPKPTKEP